VSGLPFRQAVLVHQVHPVKLAADVGAVVVSTALLWSGRHRAGAAVRYVVPVIGSAVVLATADLRPLAASPAGRYVQQHMPPAAQALRLAGDRLAMRGARRRSAATVAAGFGLVLLGWSHGLLPRRNR